MKIPIPQTRSFTFKVAAIALIPTLGLVVTGSVAILLNLSTRDALVRIAESNFPAFELGHDIADQLAALQRTLQNAASIEEEALLEDADALYKSLLAAIAKGGEYSTVDTDRLSSLRATLQRYYAVARPATKGLISHDSGTELETQLLAMTQSYRELRNELRTFADLQKADVASAMLSATDDLITVVQVLGVSLAVIIAALALFLLPILRRLRLRVAASVTLASRLAAGDVSVKFTSSVRDEFGQLESAMEEVTEYLRGMATIADLIAEGDLSKKPTLRSSEDRLGAAFVRMSDYLGDMAEVADAVAGGSVSIDVVPRSEQDRFGKALAAMVLYLREMAEVADRMASGKLAGDFAPRSAHDRFGTAFDTMRVFVQELIRALQTFSVTVSASASDLKQNAARLSESAQEQSTATNETLATMSEMEQQSTMLAELAHGLDEQMSVSATANDALVNGARRMGDDAGNLKRVVQENAKVMEDVASAINDIAERAGHVGVVSKQAVEVVENGSQELKRVINAIAKRSDDINGIMRFLGDIADQTHLLALNAAILAAQAGDAGRGFSVVADQVKSLAESSVRSVGEIGEVVESIRRDTSEAVSLTDETLSRIRESVARATSLVGEVVATTEQQRATTGVVLGASQQMLGVADSITNSATSRLREANEMQGAGTAMKRLVERVTLSSAQQHRATEDVRASAEHASKNASDSADAANAVHQSTDTLADLASELSAITESVEV